MCMFCNHEKKGGFENTAIGTWSKGVSLIFCSSIFLLYFINEDELTILNKNIKNGEYKMIYYLSIYNLIGALILLIFSLLGHFIYKPLLRPIYLGSFIVSLFLFSSGVYTTSISKNISLKIIGIMDALKFHPEYMLLNKVNELGSSIDILKVPVKNQLPSIEPIAHKNGDRSDISIFEASTLLNFIKNRGSFLESKKEMLLKVLGEGELLKDFKNLRISNGNFQKQYVEKFLLELYDKLKGIHFNFDIYDNFYKFIETNTAFITNSEKIKSFTDKFQKIVNAYNKSLFNSLKYELIKQDNQIIKIYLDSIDKIKIVKAKNENAKLEEYIDDLKKRNILIISSVFLLMSFIYIHKGATLTTESSMSISLIYIPSMSYLITLACIFVCSGIFFFSLIGLILYIFSLILIFFLIFSQCFCEYLFKFFMGFIFLFLFLFCCLIGYILVEDFNEGLKFYNEYKKNGYNDFYWVLLNKKSYEYFKSFILFSNGNMFLICIALCIFMIIYSLYSTFYNFRSICGREHFQSSI